MGDVFERDPGWWRQRRGGSRESGPPEPPVVGATALSVPLTHMIRADEGAVIATSNLDGHLGIFVETVAHPGIVVGSRVCLRLRRHDFPCTVVSLTRDADDVVAWGLYLALEDARDLSRLAYYFASRDAVFFEPLLFFEPSASIGSFLCGGAHMWTNFYAAGGWGMYPVSVLGFLMIAASALYALRPGQRAARLVLLFGLLTIASGVLGTATGVCNSAHYLPAVAQPRQLELLALGCEESLHDLVLALMLAIVGGLIASVGILRTGERGGGEAAA